MASGLLKYPAHKFLAVIFAGAVDSLPLVYGLFDFFGLTATAVFGLRWITALAMILFGGTATVLLAAKSQKQGSISVIKRKVKKTVIVKGEATRSELP
jgi:hypothetical protein